MRHRMTTTSSLLIRLKNSYDARGILYIVVMGRLVCANQTDAYAVSGLPGVIMRKERGNGNNLLLEGEVLHNNVVVKLTK